MLPSGGRPLGHIRLGILPQSKSWRDVVALIASGADTTDVAGQAAYACRKGLSAAASDSQFMLVIELLVDLPHEARGPGFNARMDARGIADRDSVPGLLVGLSDWISAQCLSKAIGSDMGEIGRSALLVALSDHLGRDLPALFDPQPGELRRALGRLAAGDRFAALARSFFAETVSRTLDYYLSRELSNHVGEGKRFGSDAERVQFDRALRQHAWEASRIVETYAGGWYGKTVWRDENLDDSALRKFASYSLTKLRRELEMRDHGRPA